MRKQRRSESGKEAAIGRGIDGPKESETKVEDRGEPEEAAAEIESGGRRKEIADEVFVKLRVLRSTGRNHSLMDCGF